MLLFRNTRGYTLRLPLPERNTTETLFVSPQHAFGARIERVCLRFVHGISLEFPNSKRTRYWNYSQTGGDYTLYVIRYLRKRLAICSSFSNSVEAQGSRGHSVWFFMILMSKTRTKKNDFFRILFFLTFSSVFGKSVGQKYSNFGFCSKNDGAI